MDYWFSLKKLLSICLNPVSLVLELGLLGVFLIAFASRRPRRPLGPRQARLRGLAGDFGVSLVCLGLLALYLSSIDPVARSLAMALESRHPPLEERDGVPLVPGTPDFVVVLAGGQLASPGKPELSRLSRTGLARVVGGVDFWKRFPASRLVVTGHPDETAAMRTVAERLGVPGDRILEETGSRDTKDHPVMLRPILGDSPFLLVTSAMHLPRAAALFRSRGYDPVLAPVDFLLWPAPPETDPYRSGPLVPRVFNLELTTRALHEIGGMAWSRWRGEIGRK